MADLSKALEPLISRVRTDVTWKKEHGKTFLEKDVPLDKDRILQHLNNIKAAGVCPIKEGETTTRVGLLDLDSHKGETSWADMELVCGAVCDVLERKGMFPVAFRSSGGHGIHIFCVWEYPQDAYSVRETLREALAELGYTNGTKGVHEKQIEIFPKQDGVPHGGFGNQFILPLTGKSVPLDPIFCYAPDERDEALKIKWKNSHSVLSRERPLKASNVRRNRYDGKLDELHKMLKAVDPDDSYDDWIRVGMAIHQESEGSDEGCDLFDEWSSMGKLYVGSEEIDMKWKSFRSDKARAVTAGFIKNLAEHGGYSESTSDDFEDVSSTPGVPPEPKRERLAIITLEDLGKWPKPKWWIKHIKPQGHNQIYGGTGDGKTFVELDMAFHIALGKDWNGYRTTQGKILYIVAEGSGSFYTRCQALAKHHGFTMQEMKENFRMIADTPNFTTIHDARIIEQKLKKMDFKPQHIVVDTWAQTTAGADENSGKDMGTALSIIGKLCANLGCSYDIIHHSGKDETRGSRGWSGFKGAVDSQLHVYRKDNKRVIWVDKMRDGKDDFGFEFQLRTIDVDYDEEDGKAITSCYVEYMGGKMAKGELPKETKFGRWEELALEAIDALSLTDTTVNIKSVIEECNRHIAHDGTRKDRRGERIERALTSLCAKGHFTFNNKNEIIPTELGNGD